MNILKFSEDVVTELINIRKETTEKLRNHKQKTPNDARGIMILESNINNTQECISRVIKVMRSAAYRDD
jgi:hypothetical protein